MQVGCRKLWPAMSTPRPARTAPSLMDLPIPEAARRVTLAQVDRWIDQAARLGKPDDPEALHDYRTAIRRLRSLIRYFQTWLPEVPRGTRRKLRRLMALTGQSRDLEVFRIWIGERQAGLTVRQHPGTRWLLERLMRRSSHADELMLGRLGRRATKLQRKLRAAVRRGAPEASRRPGTPRAGPVIRRLVRREAALLSRRLGAIHSLANRAEIHRARIAAKRVRYLIEPFQGELLAGSLLVERLHELQNRFGAVTDVHAAADELREALVVAGASRASRVGQELLPWPSARPEAPSSPPAPRNAQSGLLALARELRREGDLSFARLREWIETNWSEVEQMLERAGRIGSRGGRI